MYSQRFVVGAKPYLPPIISYERLPPCFTPFQDIIAIEDVSHAKSRGNTGLARQLQEVGEGDRCLSRLVFDIVDPTHAPPCPVKDDKGWRMNYHLPHHRRT